MSSAARPGAPEAGSLERFTVAAEAIVFGFPATPVELRIRRRAVSWRAGGAARRLVTFLLLTPLVAIVPPHAPWAIGAVTAGDLFARRRWLERFTLEEIRGACPKCGEPLRVKAARLRMPHAFACEACHDQSTLRLPAGALEEPSRPA